MRLAQYLAHAGIASRRKAEILMAEGRVRLNGELVREPGTEVDPAKDRVEYNGQPVKLESKIYILLNKPAAYISSVSDPQGRKTVLDLLPDIDVRVYPVGRLDYDTEGLLLLTNDGYFANLMIHPRYKVEKTYTARVRGRLNKAELDQLKKGVKLDDGWTAPARVDILKSDARESILKITIHEGRKRQVRRMCEAIGHQVIHLERSSFAFLTLKGVAPGHYRHLKNSEVKQLIKLAREGK